MTTIKHKFQLARDWLKTQQHTKASHDMIALTIRIYEGEL